MGIKRWLWLGERELAPLTFWMADGDGDGDGDGGAGGGGGDGGNSLKFSQDDVNRIMRKENEKYKQEKQALIGQLKELEKQKGLSDEARANLATQIREVEESLLTEKDQAKAALERAQKEHQAKLDAERERADRNWGMYVSERKRVEIAAAATKHGAYRVEQLAAVVEPRLEVVPVKGEDGAVLGYDVAVPTKVKKEDGTVVDERLTVDQYVESIKGHEDYANLFVSSRPGGTGFRPGSGAPVVDPSKLSATDKIKAGLKANAR